MWIQKSQWSDPTITYRIYTLRAYILYYPKEHARVASYPTRVGWIADLNTPNSLYRQVRVSVSLVTAVFFASWKINNHLTPPLNMLLQGSVNIW